MQGKSEKYQRVWDGKNKRHVRVHRLVAEQLLGRPLAPREVVHHKNGDKLDNRPENLAVMRNQRQHMAVEHFGREVQRGQLPLFDVTEWTS